MPELQLKINERAFNKQFKQVWESDADILVLYGGGGSGKSQIIAQDELLLTLLIGGHRMVNWRKVNKTIRISQFLLLNDEIKRWGMEKLFDINKTDMTITCKVNGNQILSIGLDDREKIKSLVQPTRFWINEVSELDREDFQQLLMRLRGYSKHLKQILIDFNPIDEYHWLKDWFFTPSIQEQLKTKKFARLVQDIEVDGKIVTITSDIWHSTWRDNLFLTDADKAKYEMMKNIDPNYYNIYSLGLWGKIGNLVYPDGYTIIEKEDYPKEYDEVIYGLDFGYTNPSCLVRIGLKNVDSEKGKYLEAYLEELLYEERLTVKDLAQRMSGLGIKPTDSIYADCADPTKIDVLNLYEDENGQPMFSVFPADKDVKNGLDYVRGIKRYSCAENVNLNKEIVVYRWKADARSLPIDGEPIKYKDHCFVAGTKIASLDGYRNIEELKVGDLVLTRIGFRKIIYTHKTENQDVYYYPKLGLTSTSGHLVFTNDDFIPIHSLTLNDTFCILDKKEFAKCLSSEYRKLLKLMESNSDVIPMHQLQILGNIIGVKASYIKKASDIYTFIFGKNIISKKFPRGIIYIMKMVIPIITRLRISNARNNLNISLTISRSGIGKIKKRFLSIYKTLTISLRSGTVRQTVKSGIVNMVKKVLGEESLRLAFVSNAESLIKQNNPRNQSSATQTVKRGIDAESKGKQTVYNITVEDCPEYFANNILVHNCMDAERYALYTHHQVPEFKMAFI